MCGVCVVCVCGVCVWIVRFDVRMHMSALSQMAVMLCVAVCCSVLQCVAVSCCVLQCPAMHMIFCMTSRFVCVCVCTLADVVCCSVLQCVAVSCSAHDLLYDITLCVCVCLHSCRESRYRVAKAHRMPYLDWSSFAKEPCD